MKGQIPSHLMNDNDLKRIEREQSRMAAMRRAMEKTKKKSR